MRSSHHSSKKIWTIIMFGKTFFLLCCVGVIFGMGKQRQSISMDQYTVIHINIVFSKPLNLLFFFFFSVMFPTFHLSNLFYSFFLLARKNCLHIFLLTFSCVALEFSLEWVRKGNLFHWTITESYNAYILIFSYFNTWTFFDYEHSWLYFWYDMSLRSA